MKKDSSTRFRPPCLESLENRDLPSANGFLSILPLAQPPSVGAQTLTRSDEVHTRVTDAGDHQAGNSLLGSLLGGSNGNSFLGSLGGLLRPVVQPVDGLLITVTEVVLTPVNSGTQDVGATVEGVGNTVEPPGGQVAGGTGSHTPALSVPGTSGQGQLTGPFAGIPVPQVTPAVVQAVPSLTSPATGQPPAPLPFAATGVATPSAAEAPAAVAAPQTQLAAANALFAALAAPPATPAEPGRGFAFLTPELPQSVSRQAILGLPSGPTALGPAEAVLPSAAPETADLLTDFHPETLQRLLSSMDDVLDQLGTEVSGLLGRLHVSPWLVGTVLTTVALAAVYQRARRKVDEAGKRGSPWYPLFGPAA